MFLDSFAAPPYGEIEVILDGLPVPVPTERRSFNAIRSYLESLALQRQRIVCALNVDGTPVSLGQPRSSAENFARVEGETMSLEEVPAQLIQAALQQTAEARAQVQSAVELVLINDDAHARELWWHLSTALKEPLLTLSLLPENQCGPANGRASLLQLRKWQLQQLGGIIQDVDAVADSADTTELSAALERRVVPWLDNLHESLRMFLETVLAGLRAPQRKA